MNIRYAKPEDLDRLTEIDNYYIANSHATFYVEPRKPEDRREWFSKYNDNGPYRMIVCEEDGLVQGCAFSSRYRDHFAFTYGHNTITRPVTRGGRPVSILYPWKLKSPKGWQVAALRGLWINIILGE